MIVVGSVIVFLILLVLNVIRVFRFAFAGVRVSRVSGLWIAGRNQVRTRPSPGTHGAVR